MTETVGQRSSDQRVVRVFVSSTFRDMQAERDELMKWTFPRLRKLCESRGVTWGEVDLRWGVTDEQKADGQVLPICLAEIRNCRPYFLGLLGERYGWIPQEIDEAALAQEPWLEAHRGKSVTELEILQGVLNDPSMARHAFFYFRNPAYATTPDLQENAAPEEIVEHGLEEAERRAAERRASLASLKRRIKTSGLPVREDYADPQALGDLVFRDLSAAIDEVYPRGSEPEPIDREAAAHEAFAASRAHVYIGRDEYFDALDAHAAGDGLPLVIVGESGAGKSALVATWALDYRASHPDDVVLLHFTGASPASGYWAAMLVRILGELQRRLQLELERPAHPEALRAVFANALHMAAGKRRLVLVLEGLDQLEDRDGAPDLVWLPPDLPSNVRLVVSTLEGRPLNELRRRGWPTLEVNPLEREERARLIVGYLAQQGRRLDPALVRRITGAEQTSNPLYLRALVEELRVWGQHETLERRIDHYLRAATVDDLYEKILERYEQDYERDVPGLVGQAASLLWAARRGLTEAELLELLGSDEEPLQSAFWSPLYLAAEQSLASRNGLLSFAHEYVRTAVENRYLSTRRDRQAAHERVARYFEGRELDTRKVEELPWQLVQADAWPRLAELLADLDFVSAAWDVDQFEVKSFWADVERNSAVRIVDAYRGVLDALDQHPPESLWRLGRLLGEAGYPNEALPVWHHLAAHARGIGDVPNLIPSLGEQANLLMSRWDFDAALPLVAEQERLCRELGDMHRLQVALGNQAVICFRRGDLDGSLARAEEQERICRKLDDVQGLQVAMGHRANVLFARGEDDAALALLKEKQRLCLLLGNRDGLQIAFGVQARILSKAGDHAAALPLFEKQEELCREVGIRQGLAESLGGQGDIFLVRGNLDRAMASYKEQEALCREIGFKDGLQHSLGNQAAVLQARGDSKAALALFEKQEALCRELRYDEGLERCLGNQAVILERGGALDEALALVGEQERLCRGVNKDGLRRALNAQASILMRRADDEAALERLREHEELCRDLGDLEGLAASLNNQAVIVYRRGDLDAALPLFEAQSQVAREREDMPTLQRLLFTQAAILHGRGDRDGALPLLQEHGEIARELGDKQELQRSLGNQAEIVFYRGDIAGALALLEEQAGLCRELGDVEALQRCLSNQQVFHRARADLDAILAPFREEERLRRGLGDLEGVRQALSDQIDALVSRGVFGEALAPVEAAASISRELGDLQGLAVTLATKATLLARLGRQSDAVHVAEEASPLLEGHGPDEVGRELEPFLEAARSARGHGRLEPSEKPLDIPAPDPRADPQRAAQLSRQYHEELARWNALPWWKRRSAKRPERPTGI